MKSETLQKYPQRNQAWSFHSEDNSFTIEESTLQGNGTKDPWNRPLNLLGKTLHKNDEGDTTHWTGYTTVAGDRVDLTIWND